MPRPAEPSGLGSSPADPGALLRPPLSLALAGLRLRDDGPEVSAADLREAIALAQQIGCRAVTWNGAAPGLRARDLDRSSRREAATLLRRAGLEPGGVDLWIPPEHFGDPAHADRAQAAAAGAIELAADMAAGVQGERDRVRPVLNVMLPVLSRGGLAEEVIHHLFGKADKHGVRIADHQWPPRLGEPIDRASPLGVGLDPAAVMGAGDDAVSAATRLGAGLASARLSDLGTAGRCVPGAGNEGAGGGGRLDVRAYADTLGALGYRGWVVVDVRSLAHSARAASRAAAAWRS